MDFNDEISNIKKPDDIRRIVENLIREYNNETMFESQFVHHIQSLMMKSMEIGAKTIVSDMFGYNTQLKFWVQQTSIMVRNGYELAVRDATITFNKRFGGNYGYTSENRDQKNRGDGNADSDPGASDDLPW